jgi:hypothetical protein
LDLTRKEIVGWPEVTLEFVASRIHAGYELDITKTKIFIPPPVERYLTWYFLPFADLIRIYGRLISEGRIINKARLFEEALITWFQSVLNRRDGSFGDWAQGFCPKKSILYKKSWILDRDKIKFGPQILWNSSPTNPNTTSTEQLAQALSDYLDSKEVDLYFPGPCSQSPDIFLLPNLGPEGIIIGVQAKCYSSERSDGSTKPLNGLSINDIEQEARKMYWILERVRVKRHESVKGVFIMCATTGYK